MNHKKSKKCVYLWDRGVYMCYSNKLGLVSTTWACSLTRSPNKAQPFWASYVHGLDDSIQMCTYYNHPHTHTHTRPR